MRSDLGVMLQACTAGEPCIARERPVELLERLQRHLRLPASHTG